jgi:lipopolysaccharide/colanic/teichoic acid biosynthesis glycosyltransferase
LLRVVEGIRDQGTKGLPRILELPLVVVGLIVVSPVLGALALAVRLDSPGPALFRQTRIGLGGRPFELLKFRSMRVDAVGSAVTAGGDPRVTRVGRVLRRFRLDELPQLWNVVRGEMALVGPRPEVPRFVDLDDPRWQMVLSVRPGITDPTTVAFADEEQRLAALGGDPDVAYREQLLPAKLASQLAWLERRSVGGDLSALWATVRVLIRS